MNASFVSSLAAAHDAAGAQHYPQGCLYVVATPIGNLADISLRALHVLTQVDQIACEDTRHTQALLRAWGIDKPHAAWLALHEHNEAQAAQAVVQSLHQGLRVAYCSDAGTPAISDPGARLVAAVQAAGLRTLPLPGASSLTAALCVSGARLAEGFVFAGFLPTKASERTRAVERLASESRAVVLLEAPHRIEALAQVLQRLGHRPVTVARELTKQFEEVAALGCDSLLPWLQARPERTKGEFALVLHPAPTAAPEGEGLRILKVLLQELPLKTAAKLAAQLSGESRNDLYAAGLGLRGD